MRVILTAGHNGKGTGASGIIDEGTETIKFRNAIGANLRGVLGSISLAMDNDTTDFKSVLKWLKTIDRGDVLVDVHFNAFNKKAHGTEVIVACDADKETIAFAEGLLNVVCDTLGTNNRGVKDELQSQHSRLAMLHTGSADKSVLLEVCFCDNADDVEKYILNRDLLSLNIAKYLAGVKFDKPRKDQCIGLK